MKLSGFEKLKKYEIAMLKIRFSDRQRRVLLCLCCRANWNADEIRVSEISDQEITEITGLRQDIISYTRRELVAFGVIEADGARSRHSYRLVAPSSWKIDGEDSSGENPKNVDSHKLCNNGGKPGFAGDSDDVAKSPQNGAIHKSGGEKKRKSSDDGASSGINGDPQNVGNHKMCESINSGKSRTKSRKPPQNRGKNRCRLKITGFPPHPPSQRGNNYNYAVAACSSDPPSKSVKNRGPEASEEVKILMDFGIPADEAESIASSHSSSQIRKQAFYMPYRENILYPDRALVAAIEKSWKKPPLAPLWPGETKRNDSRNQAPAPNGSGFIKYDILEFLDGNLRVI